jgi:DNA mismatch repair protein MutS2
MSAGEHLQSLEWPLLLKHYSNHCASGPGKAIAETILPETIRSLAEEKLAETAEAILLLEETNFHFLAGIEVLDPILERCAKSAVLDGKELIHLCKLLEVSAELKETIQSLQGVCPAPKLTTKSQQIEVIPRLAQKIRDCLDPDGRVKDSASPLLRSLRDQERKLHVEAKDKLETVLQQAFREGRLQDKYYDFRDGRYLIPVKSEHKNKVPGLVVESSATRATVFVEPASVRACNDQIKQTELFIEEEIYRILSELSQLLYPHAPTLKINYDVVIALDLIFGRGAFSLELQQLRGSSRPKFTDRFLLEDCYHPLLAFVLNPEKVIRNSFHLGPSPKVLIISGPNTGGKTILLKAVGMASLMAQSGIYVACAGESQLPFFDSVLAQIGDSQSLELSLSSFSGSILQLKEILEAPSHSPLVLIDEILHATDPDEATALSRAILEKVEARGGFAIVTTHLNGLKVGSNFSSASMEFHLESLSPTYRLRLGVPGSSRALEIAQKLGLDSFIINRARSFLDTNKISHQESLDRLEAQERFLSESKEQLASTQKAMELEKEKFSQVFEALKKEKASFRKDALEKFKEQQRIALGELDDLISQYRRKLIDVEEKHRATQESKAHSEQLKTVYERAIQEISTTIPEAPEEVEKKESAESFTDHLEKNGKVFVRNLNQEGVLLSDPKQAGNKPAEVQIGNVRMRIPWEQLKGKKSSWQPSGKGNAISLEISVAGELNLIGKNVDEGRDLLMQYLDQAFRSGRPWVRIVHGHGSGALKKMVREILQKSVYETKFRPGMSNEGGDGCTVVEFV